MGKPSLILAALAVDALPNMRFSQVQDISSPDESLITQLLTTDQGERVVFKSPKDNKALTELGIEIRALRVLKNLQLPFKVPTLLGETSATALYKAFAFDYMDGDSADFSRMKLDDQLVTSIAETLAQIHSIPASLVVDAGLPEYDPALRNKERFAGFDRAMETGRIDPSLLERWQNALLDVNLFRYQPTTVHGSVNSSVFAVRGGTVIGVSGWSQLAVDDPALDLAGLFEEVSVDLANAIFLAYEGFVRPDRNLKQRANLYYELGLAAYLLWALEHGDQGQIDEAEALLAGLVSALEEGLLPSLAPADFAANSNEVVTPISQAASFTSPINIVTEQIEVVDLEPGEPTDKEN
jgi:aminoglycoside phosphotransferase (APT) family kinase protein